MFSGFSALGSRYANIPQTFEEFFRCYPIAMMNDRIRKDDANYGGKVFLPPSALNRLSMLNVRYPMLFRLESNEKVTHGGVLEFIAEEGRVYLPQWMMDTLEVQPGSLLKVSTTDVPLGNFVKLEPQSVDFLDISDPKAVLENVLRKFSTLTIDDIIEISYNSKIYKIKILEVKPESNSKGICVIETDLVTDFAPPVGYVEPDYEALKNKQADSKKEELKSRTFDASKQVQGSMATRLNYGDILSSSKSNPHFVGEGQKISGKSTKEKGKDIDLSELKISLENEPAILDLPDGQLFFGFPIVLPEKEDSDDTEDHKKKSDKFQGSGQSLRKSKKSKQNDRK